jgi:TRAP-type C4-dicarboxylate transport system substrate-binding protein
MKSCLLFLSVVIVFSACERHSAEETAPFHEEHEARKTHHNSAEEVKKDVQKDSNHTERKH